MNKNIFLTLIAVSFILIVGLVIRYTGAADVSTSAEVTNEASVIDTINFSTSAYGADDLTETGILPNVGTTRTIYVNGIISDANGEEDLVSSTFSLVFHRTSSTNACSEDNNDCYQIISCATDYNAGDDTQIAYNCEVPIAYWIDATDSSSIYEGDTWTAQVRVVESESESEPITSEATVEVNSLLALNLPDAIDYANRSLSEQSSEVTNIETPIIQRGNTRADLEVKGGNMNCSVLGSLATSSQAWALDDVDYNSSTILSDTFEATGRNINLRTDETEELIANLYWNIAIPASGVKGTCTGANTLVIVANGYEEAYLVDGRVKNARYTTPNRTGYTGDNGNLVIVPGETTSFYIGDVFLGSIAYDDIPADRLIFFQNILGIGRTDTTDPKLTKIAQFVQSIAEETTLTGATVLTIPETAHTLLTTNIDFDTADETALQTEVQKVHLGKIIRTETEAQEHLAETLAIEVVEEPIPTYTVSTSQGVNTTISPSSNTVEYGNTTTFTVSADPGYIPSVSGCDGSLLDNTYTTGSITADCTVTVIAAVPACGAINTVAYAGGPFEETGTTRNQGGYYRTVSIGSQCWLRDNLNIGTMIASATTEPLNNGTVEKWCHGGAEDSTVSVSANCDSDGGLYNWDEAMAYSTIEGAQGICPSGWHVPTDTEFKTLEMSLGMTEVEADKLNVWRGTNEGTKLKYGSSGFDMLLVGSRSPDWGGKFVNRNSYVEMWMSSRYSFESEFYPWIRGLYSGFPTVLRQSTFPVYGMPVRCLKN